MSQDKTIRVMIADDHPVLRTGLTLMFKYEPEIEVVAVAANGQEAVELFQEHHPDVTLMDLRMPLLNGAETTAAIRKTFPSARIIVLTTYDDEEAIYQCLRAGAQAYLLKDTTCEEILQTIRLVYAGQKRITDYVGIKLAERASLPVLTEREVEVLQQMARGRSNKEISAALFIAEGTVKFHINHILNKLAVNDRTQAVITALKRGLATLD